MATQPISPSGAVYSGGGYVAEVATRPLSVAASYQIAGTLLAQGALRPISDAGVRSELDGFLRVGADRALSPALLRYATAGILSFLNVRFLSAALGTYAAGTVVRSAATRSMSPGFLGFVPPPPAPPEDTSPPTVANFAPAPGTPIARGAPIAFDVTDDSGTFRRIFVMAHFPRLGVTEVIHDGDGFRGPYAAASARAFIAYGFRYSVLRGGGWPDAPTILVHAIDASGNEDGGAS